MSDNLKKFINDNREEFDNARPSEDLWEKIGSRMENNSSNWIKSKWLKYFAFGISMIALSICLVFFMDESGKEKEFVVDKLEGTAKTTGNLPEINSASNGSEKELNTGSAKSIPPALSNPGSRQETNKIDSILLKKDTIDILNKSENLIIEAGKESEKISDNSAVKKENESLKKNKTGKLVIPAAPDKINTYSGTLYDGSLLCDVLRVYKFPGKVSMAPDGNYTSHRTLQTTSCSRLEGMDGIKAVWIKGKTDKEFTLTIKNGLKNIVLEKNDGRKINPEAISHYYQGLGVITGYAGKYLNMVFKDKVDIILFFKDAEEGDKIIIDGILEAVVTKP